MKQQNELLKVITSPSTSMEVSAFIDWISFTHFGSSEVRYPDALPLVGQLDKAHNGYNHAVKYRTGIVEMYNTERPDMGVHIIYSGKVLEKIATEYGVSRDEILRFHTTLQDRIARIDFAIDLRNSSLNIQDLWLELEEKRAKTKSSHTRVQNGFDKGYTLYVGSTKSRKKLLRVYDKAKELGDFLSDYKRVELETRQDVARNATKLYQDTDYSASTVLSMVKGFCDFPQCDVWSRCFAGECSKIPVGTHERGETEKWLLKNVAPAMARVLADNPTFWAEFRDRVTYHMMSGDKL